MPKNTSSRSELFKQPGYFHPFSFVWDDARALEVIREEAFAEGYAEGYAKGYEESRAEVRAELIAQIALSLLKNNVPLKFITESTHLSAEEIEKIAKEHHLTI